MSPDMGDLPEHVFVVPQAWCDYNRHFSDGYYLVAFSSAADTALDAIGLGAAYRAQGDFSAYSVEAHLRYLREAMAGETLAVRHVVRLVNGKCFRLQQEMRRDDTVVATCEFVYLHVDTRVPRAAELPDQVRAAIARHEPPG